MKSIMDNNFFSIFKPKESKFFPLLNELADVLVSISELNLECIKAKTHKDIHDYTMAAKDLRSSSMRRYKRIFRELNYTFITPFDREDINNLATQMYDTVEFVSSCTKRIMLYNPHFMPETADVLAEIMLEAAELIKKAVHHLKDLKNDSKTIDKACIKLDEIETKADDIYDNFLIELFQNEKDAIELVKIKDILHELERATDSANMVGKTINNILVKYA